MLRAYLITLIIPLSLIALAIPLILEKVPRNPLYGFRTPYTMSSDAIWYRANKICGIAVLAGGVIWLLLGQILPHVMDSQRSAYRLLAPLGAAVMLAGCAVSFWLTYRKSG